jgi:hypothetical protein
VGSNSHPSGAAGDSLGLPPSKPRERGSCFQNNKHRANLQGVLAYI